MFLRVLAFWLPLFLCGTPLLWSQFSRPAFENISSRHGQIHSNIEHMMQDDYGFIWFATNQGLYRYDGYTFKGYLHDVNDSLSPPSPGVHHVVEDADGDIWISSVYGVSRLDRRTGHFRHYLPFPGPSSTKGRNNLGWLHVDRDDRLLAIGGPNVFILHPESGRFQELGDSEPSGPRLSISNLVEQDDGTMWCGTNHGLLRISPGDTSYTRIVPGEGTTTKYQKGIIYVMKGSGDELWISTSDGVAIYNTSTDIIRSAPLPENMRGIRAGRMMRTRDGHCFLGMIRNGLLILDPNGEHHHFGHDENKFRSLGDNFVHSLMQDRAGNIWIGTSTGIRKITHRTGVFTIIKNAEGADRQANQIWRIHEDRSGTLWTLTSTGLHFKRPGASAGRLSSIAGVLGNIGRAGWFYEDRKGALWVPVAGRGLWKNTPGNDDFIQLAVEPALRNTIIHRILEDDHDPGLLWIGTNRGLARLDKQSLDVDWFRPREQIPQVSSDRVVIFDQIGDEIWLYYTFHNTLGQFDKLTGKFTLHRPPPESQPVLEGVIRDMVVTADRNVWIASTFGLTRYDIEASEYRIYTKDHGIPHSILNGAILDRNQDLWVSGNQFVARFNRADEQFDFVRPAREIKTFISKGRHVSESGRLYFGGLNGIFSFHPDSIRLDAPTPKVVLTDFRVKDTTRLLDAPFEEQNSIRLSPGENDFSFTLAGLHFSDPEGVQYRCLLEGYDEEWRQLGKQRSVNYTNLSPGDYVFRATAANREGVWSDDELEIPLIIEPAFTQTLGFKLLMGILLIGLILIALRIWRTQQDLRQQKRVAEETAEYRKRFLSDISHEIRTPMNAIIGLSGLLNEMPAEPQQRKYLTAIQRSSQDLLQMINSLLDQSKLDSGTFTFHEEAFEPARIFSQLQTLLGPLAQEKELDLSFHIADQVPAVLVGDQLRLSQILTNLIGNAIKFTSSGSVRVQMQGRALSDQQFQLDLAVSDSGVGISPDKLGRIFDRFTQDQGAAGITGTGLGLFITRELVERQGGTIRIESELQKGTRVSASIPVRVSPVNGPGSEMTHPPVTTMDEHLSLLLVDDDPLNLMVLEEIFRKRAPNIRVATSDNATDGIARLKSGTFDLVIMDVKMPGIDGLEATRMIRSLKHPAREVVILGATASAMESQLEACIDSGMNDVITKPIDADTLLQKIGVLKQLGI